MLNQPIAQTFHCDVVGGMFVTSAEVFFRTKDNSLPVIMEIRDTINGYPGNTILPFSKLVKNRDDVRTSADGEKATKEAAKIVDVKAATSFAKESEK